MDPLLNTVETNKNENNNNKKEQENKERIEKLTQKGCAFSNANFLSYLFIVWVLPIVKVSFS
jgi:hypothetical protein